VTDDERLGTIEAKGGDPRFTQNPRVMGGKPCIRGTRVTVSTIAGLLASGHSEAEVLDLYPYLGDEDVRAVGEWVAGRTGRRRESASRRSRAHG
jgi:uncharacterized protein (DUF433 family)